MTTTYFAGIDGGGTKTEVVVVDAGGREVARVLDTSSNAAVVGHAAAGSVLRQAVTEALARTGANATLAAAWFGLSGSDRAEDQRRLGAFVEHLAPQIRITNDAELVLGALPGATGVAVVSGTGSIAVGRNASGARARSGGWGHVFGDEGSGYDLARRMFAAYAREVDGRGPATSLTTRLTEHWSLLEPHQLIARVYAPSTTKGELANLGRIVVEEAAAGDAVAIGILDESAIDLAGTVAAVARRLGFSRELPLALSGSLLIHVAPFRNRVIDALRRQWPGLASRVVDDPALTAARALSHTSMPKETDR